MRDKRLEIRCIQSEIDTWSRESSLCGYKDLSGWIRWALNNTVLKGKSPGPKEIKVDNLAAKLGVTKGGEILEKPKVAVKPKRVENTACKVLGHVPMVTDEDDVLKCSRCGVRWKK